MINDVFLDDLREKTIRGLTGQALKGYVCGGRVYGYKNVPIFDASKTDPHGRPLITAVTREIDPEQAKWVKQIFEWYAEGNSPRWIVKKLNEMSIPSPRGKNWSYNSVYANKEKGSGILSNQLYVGEMIWNRTQWIKDPDTGVKKRFERPESEWIVKDMPELRIIDQNLWDAVKARQAKTTQASAKIRERLHANARTGAGPKYLFSGLLQCGECGGNFIIINAKSYGCANRRNKGEYICSNKVTVPRSIVEDRLLHGIKNDLFDDESVEVFKKETTQFLREEQLKQKPDHDADRKRLAVVEREIDQMISAIKNGLVSDTLKSELEAAEKEKNELLSRLQINTKALDKIVSFLPDATSRFERLVSALDKSLQSEVNKARYQLKKLLGGSVKLYPQPEGYLEAELAGDFAGLMNLANNGKLSLVAGRGFEPLTFGL